MSIFLYLMGVPVASKLGLHLWQHRGLMHWLLCKKTGDDWKATLKAGWMHEFRKLMSKKRVWPESGGHWSKEESERVKPIKRWSKTAQDLGGFVNR